MSAQALTAKPYKGLGMEGVVAKWYAALTRRGIDDFKALARRTAAELPAGSRVLEVAPGPGYFAIELAKLGGYRINGLDISETFVEIARQNAARANVAVDFRRGNASSMPFRSQAFDFILCRAAFKNFADPVGALQEMCRVLKPSGRALIIDLRRDASWNSIQNAVDEMRVGAVNAVVTKLTFRFMLLRRAYTKSELERFVSETDFQTVDIRESAIGLEVWLGKASEGIVERAKDACATGN